MYNIEEFLPENDEMKIFLKINNALDIFLIKNNFTDISNIPKILIYAILKNDLFINNNIILVGFYKLSHFIKILFNMLSKKNNITVFFKKSKKKKIKLNKIIFEDSNIEYKTSFLWAKKKIKKNHRLKIGIIVNNLEKNQNYIKNIFNLYSYNKNDYTVVYPIFFVKFNIIKVFLYLLDIFIEPINYNIFSFFLRSPYIGGAYLEYEKRLKSDTYIKKHKEQFYHIKNLIIKLKQSPNIKYRLKNFQKYKSKKIDKKKHTVYWKNFLFKCLKILGFPNYNVLNIREKLIYKKLKKIINDYTFLDKFIGEHSIIKFINHIKNLLHISTYIDKKKSNIEVRDICNSSLIKFDYLWICGISKESFLSTNNPFIPLFLQIKFNLPNSSFLSEYKYCKYTIFNFINLTNYELILSYSKYENNIKKSSLLLLNNILFKKNKYINNKEKKAHISNKILLKEKSIYDNKKLLYGGINSIYTSNKCLFKSFFIFRLKINELEELNSYILNYEKGLIIHDILRKVWNKIKSSFRLNALSSKNLDKFIKKNTYIIYNRYLYIRPFSLNKHKYYNEAYQTIKLIKTWIFFEKDRKKNYYIKYVEKEVIYKILGYKIKFRIDRIDSIYKSNQILIIDYKYSSIFSNSYIMNNPTILIQLIFYYYCINFKFASLHYAILFSKQLKLINIGREFLLTSIKNEKLIFCDWNEIFYYCNKIIVKNIIKYIKGELINFPEDISECSKCNLQSLCKKYEKN